MQSYLEKVVEDNYSKTKRNNGKETFTIAKKSHTSECEETITVYVQAKQTSDETNEKLTNETKHDIKNARKLYRQYGKPAITATTPCLSRKN